MFCERCGREVSDKAAICPVCGASLARKHSTNSWQQPITSYGQYPEDDPLSYRSGYKAVPDAQPPYQEPGEFVQWDQRVPPHFYTAQQTRHARVAADPQLNVVKASTKNNNALIVEIILSLFGLFGIGWLMAGETTIGIILLICSIFIYWPLVILGTIFTFGFGLICLGPMAIGAIILNILLLNKTLDHQSTQYVITPQPVYMPPPPRQ